MSRITLMVCALALLALALPTLAGGVEFRAADNVVVGANEVIDGDLYATGETVLVEGTVHGDVVAAAREVTVAGRVDGDLIACGQTVLLSGAVGDDLRAAAMVIKLGEGATIADHIVSAGYSFEAAPTSRVGGLLVFSGAKALLAGDLDSGLRVAAGGVRIGGNVAGDADLEVSGGMEGAEWFEALLPGPIAVPSVSSGLTVADSARIGGRLSYTAPSEGTVAATAVGQGIEWTPLPAAPEAAGEPAPSLATRLGTSLRRFFALLLFGLVLFWLAPKWADARIETLASSPPTSFGWGLLGSVGAPFAAFALIGVTILLAFLFGVLSLGSLTMLVVFVGLALLATFSVGLLAITLYAGPVLVSGAAGRAILRRFDSERAASLLLPLVVGLLVYALATSLPFIGWFIGLLVLVLGLGLFVQWLIARRRTAAVSG